MVRNVLKINLCDVNDYLTANDCVCKEFFDGLDSWVKQVSLLRGTILDPKLEIEFEVPVHPLGYRDYSYWFALAHKMLTRILSCCVGDKCTRIGAFQSADQVSDLTVSDVLHVMHQIDTVSFSLIAGDDTELAYRVVSFYLDRCETLEDVIQYEKILAPKIQYVTVSKGQKDDARVRPPAEDTKFYTIGIPASVEYVSVPEGKSDFETRILVVSDACRAIIDIAEHDIRSFSDKKQDTLIDACIRYKKEEKYDSHLRTKLYKD